MAGEGGRARPLRVLAGDIGGTHARLVLAEVRGERVEPLHRAEAPSREHPDLATLLRRVLAEAPAAAREGLAAAALGLPGPVEGSPPRQRVRTTNLPWEVEAEALARALGLERVLLLNDLAAVAEALPALAEGDLAPLQAGRPEPQAPALVLGAGTGLGVAWRIPCGAAHRVLATEGGHAGFAPAGEEQRRLHAFLEAELGRVSWERVVSGPGLAALYRFLLHEHPGQGDPALLQAEDPPAAIAASSQPLAQRAVALFVALYGAVAGDLALAGLPRAGVYLAGGIAPKLLDRLRQGPFLEAFRGKGRMAPLLAQLPVQVILHPWPGLLGAALAAARALAEDPGPAA